MNESDAGGSLIFGHLVHSISNFLIRLHVLIRRRRPVTCIWCCSTDWQCIRISIVTWVVRCTL